MIKGFKFDLPTNRNEAIFVLSIIDKEMSSTLLFGSKRKRCFGINRIFKVAKYIHKVSRNHYIKSSNNNMRDVSILFSKWMKNNGCLISDL